MTEGEKELTASCYEQAEDGTYERTTNKTADLEALNDTFRMPMVMLSAMDESAETALNDGADAAAPTQEQLKLFQARKTALSPRSSCFRCGRRSQTSWAI